MRGRQAGEAAGRGAGSGRRAVAADTGATTLEYVGAVLLAAAVVLALVATGVAGSVGDRFRCSIMSVWGGGSCSSGDEGAEKPASDADYEPPLCAISTVTDKAGSKAKIGWFEWGNEYGFQDRVHRANYDVNGDGKIDESDQLIYTTFTDSASAGVTIGAGGEIEGLGEGQVDLGAGVKVNNGDTWVFKSREEAEAFREDLEDLKMYEMRRTSPGGSQAAMGDSILALFGKGPLVEEQKLRDRIEEKLGDRHISHGSIGSYGEVNGGLSLDAGSSGRLSAKLGGSARVSSDVLFTKDDYRGTESYTYSVKAEGEWGTGVAAGGYEKGQHKQANRSATVTITRDQETGELVRIDFTQTTETGASGTSEGADADNGKKGKDARGGSVGSTDNSGASDIEVHTNTLTFPKGEKGDADRAVAQAWLDGDGDGNAPLEYMLSNNAPTSRPGSDDPFGQLLFDKGKSSRTTYDGMADAQEYGFELNLGLSVGLSVSMENKAETLADAEFLGAPRGDRREYVPYSYCAQ
ncbi:hypothetical protein IQ279_12455 [Streptomyces verrucosisporus]|uniref:hypothetical protein n=1 Tax=Streptomyces verrucosisporus TaxID=1695161 RepID=UPI0019D05ADC|nr:hypothetical protein [Streptomyces verrucosisporus]MBN3930435.1 hypothetical protein [Streptomyces verrucosisporus]